MPKINLTIDHKLGQEEAKKRISGLIAQTRAQFGQHATDLVEGWNGNTNNFSFRAMGFPISGKLEVEPAQVQIEVQLPFAALPFKGRVENELRTHATKMLA